jgi:hypothetical protein
MKRQIKKSYGNLRRAYGVNDYGFADLPTKVSGTTISRLLVGQWMGCTWCFPHGWEVINSTGSKRQRSWKKYRKTQWRPK